MMCPTFYESFCGAFFKKRPASYYLEASSIATATATVIPTMGLFYFEASSIATATATVIPTIGLLPAPMRPIISTR